MFRIIYCFIRLQVVALNDDVDEPTELRTIFHTVAPCEGVNHNTGQPCLEDPLYTGINVTSIEVILVDDDIADLVVLCDGAYSADGSVATIDEEFSRVNRVKTFHPRRTPSIVAFSS